LNGKTEKSKEIFAVLPTNHNFEQLRSKLYSAVVSDVLDALDSHNHVLRCQLPQLTGAKDKVLIGRCKTTLWADMAHEDSKPYELELKAVDSCKQDDVFIAAANGSHRSALWGELLTTASMRTGSVGAIVDGLVRDQTKMNSMNFPVFAKGASPLDSKNRQKVIDLDVRVEIGGCLIYPGDIIIADNDGIVIIPQEFEEETIARALEKVSAENIVRDAIKNGLSATAAFKKYGVL